MLRSAAGASLLLACACASVPEAGPDSGPRPPTLRFSFEPQAPGHGSRSLPDGPRFGLSVHGAVLDDYEGETSGPGQGLSGDLDLSSIALQLDLLLPRSAFLMGVERREYGSADAREVYAGGRYLFHEGHLRPYLEGRARYGPGLEPRGAGDSDPYVGVGVGVGTLWRLTPRVHLDARLAYETTVGEVDLDAPGGDAELRGWVGTIGIGIGF